MATNLTERVIIFQPPQGLVVNENAIQQDPLILQAAGLSLNSQMTFSYDHRLILSGGVYAVNEVVRITFYLAANDDSTIVSGLSALQSRWPGWTIESYSRSLIFN